MKSILLSSVAAFAFAGMAAAEVTFSGEAEIEYNDNDGFSSDVDVDITLSQTLDNGLTAGATLNVGDLLDGDNSSQDYTIFIESETAALRFGNVDPVAEDRWGGVDGSAYDGFNDQDVHFSAAVGFEAMLVGEVSFGNVDAAISYGVDTDGVTAEDTVDALQVYASSAFGAATVELAYQQAFAGTDQILGLGVSTSLGGADVGLAFVNADSGQSIGVDVSYPVGPVTLGAYYTTNDNDDDAWGISADYADGPVSVSVEYDSTDDWSLEGSYDVGNGLVVYAGVVDAGDDYYLGTAYDLGGGAEFYVTYVEDGGALNAKNEIGANDYARGTTVGVSFEF